MTPSRVLAALACLALIAADDPASRLARAQREASRSAVRVAELEKKARSAIDEARQLDARAAVLAARVQQAEAGLAVSEARNAVIGQALSQSRARLAERQGKVVNLLAALESLSRRPPALALAQPGSVRDTARVALLLDGLLPVIEARTADLRRELAALDLLRQRAAASRRRVLSAQQRLDDSRGAMLAMADARRKAAGKIATASMLESDRALALSVEAKDLRQLIGSLDAEARTGERLASLPGPLPRPARIPAYALPPPDARLAAAVVTSPAPVRLNFGMPALGQVKMGFGDISEAGIRSRGLTLMTREKAQVVAPAAGRIAFAGVFRGYGNVVIIEHGKGLTTLLTGLETLDTRTTQTIAAGGPVGRMGSARRELSVEVRDNGQPVDPLSLLTRN